MTARLSQWQRLSNFGNDSSPIWTPLDIPGVASLLEPLRATQGLDCYRWLTDDNKSSESSAREDQRDALRDHGLVLLDAAGGAVSVLQQSWTEMMAAKIGSPEVAVRPSKDL